MVSVKMDIVHTETNMGNTRIVFDGCTHRLFHVFTNSTEFAVLKKKTHFEETNVTEVDTTRCART